MSTTAVGHCSHCDAVVNRHWLTCLVCHAPLIATPLRDEAFSGVIAPMPPPQVAENIVIGPAAPNARAVYWETGDTRILGPAVPEYLAMVGTDPTASFWVIVTYQGMPRWINANRLRSRKAFEEQAPVQEVELIRSC